MKKLIYGLIAVSLVMISVSTFAADQHITIKIPSDKVAKALEGFLAIYPNNETVSEGDPTLIYTNKQWVTEKVRRIIVKDVRRGLQMLANQTAKVEEDDGVAVTVE